MRSVSEIYSEAVNTRNNYLQLTELNVGRSNSKLSILNMLTYVVAVCIHTYETVLDLFQVRIVEVLAGRINGTPQWYAAMAKKFQYNSSTGAGDPLAFNEDTLKIEYESIDRSKRIIERAAYRIEESGALTLSVCKANPNQGEVRGGVPYLPLSASELTAFKKFVQQIKFVGAEVYSESCPGDIVTIVADRYNPIYYDDTHASEAQVLEGLREAMAAFAQTMEFGGMLYYQSVIDVIRKCPYVTDIGNSIRVYVSPYDPVKEQYLDPVEVDGRTRLKSGHIRFLNEGNSPTLSNDKLFFVPSSQRETASQTV